MDIKSVDTAAPGVKRGAPVSRARLPASIERAVECRIPSRCSVIKTQPYLLKSVDFSRGLAENKLRSLLKRLVQAEEIGSTRCHTPHTVGTTGLTNPSHDVVPLYRNHS